MKASFSTALALSLSLTIVGGCSASPEVNHNRTEIAEVNVPTFPAELPENVQKVARAVVAVETNTGKNPEHASGVRLMGNYVLTAGHVLIQKGTTPNRATNKCVNAIATEADGKTIGMRADGTPLTGAHGYQERLAGTHTDNQDLAMFSLSSADNTLPAVPEVKISDKPLQPGERVYLINFQPDRDGNPRNPYEVLQKPKTAGIDKRYDQPAIYAGVVLGNDKHYSNDVTVLTGLRNYGEVSDTSSRQGASGGAVVDDEGEVRAIISKTSVDTSLDPHSIAEQTGVKPTDVPTGSLKELGYTLVQPVNHQLIEDLERRVKAAHPCS